ncbi:MAG: cupin domain-containing protein [Acidimicrobiales bacterium]|nr:cupin domain-containing protein [Acidimicrobiales bacterium]
MAADNAPPLAWVLQQLDFEPLAVEGGRYVQSWVSHRHWPGNDKPAGTAILFLLTDQPGDFSALHRLASDELWHRYLGDPAHLVLLHADGVVEEIVLGPDLQAGHRVLVVVPAGTWVGCYVPPGGPNGYALLGCSMAPGFTSEDYQGGERAELCAAYPSAAELIERLTRPGEALRMDDPY